MNPRFISTANAQIFSSATALASNSINAECYCLQSKDATGKRIRYLRICGKDKEFLLAGTEIMNHTSAFCSPPD